MLTGFGKLLQRQTYTLLGTKWGLFVLLLLCVITLNGSLRLIDSALDLNITYPTWTSKRDFRDNIAKRSFEDYLCHEPIDVVYTWVNGSDPWMQSNLQRYRFLEQQSLYEEFENSTFDESKVNPSRFQDNQELRYSLRSLIQHAGWIRNIYIVTNGQIPHWININHPKIKIVTHHDIYLNKSHLPVFASPSIECHLHRIPDLSPRFLYLNDDTFFGRPVHPEDFWSAVEGHRIFFAWPVPNCAEGCPQTWVGDGYCDKTCNTEECQWDGGDCQGKNKQTNSPPTHYSYAPSPSGDDQCRSGCPDSWLGDKFCDKNCNYLECGFDAADCSWDDALAQLSVINVNEQQTGYILPYQAVFIANLTSVFSHDESITGGSFDTNIFRSATISQATKMLILICNLNKKHTSDVITLIELTGNRKKPDGELLEITILFNITLTIEAVNVTVTESLENNFDTSRHLSSIRGNEYKVRKSISVVHDFIAPNSDVGATPPENLLQTEDDHRQWYAKKQIHSRKLSQLGMSTHSESESWKLIKNLWAEQYGSLLKNDDLEEELQISKRKLLDTFGDSLKHVNRLLTTRFGASSRKVPSHMPHFIDSQIVREMHSEWSKEFEETSSHRFRDRTDMQFTFTHMYWITHATNKKNDYAFFTERLDINRNGVLDQSELRSTAIILWDKKVSIELMEKILSPDFLDTPEESSPEDESWRFKNLNASILSKWRANLTGVSHNSPEPNYEEVPQELLEKECQFGNSPQDVDTEDDVTQTKVSITPTETGELLPPLRCHNETVLLNSTTTTTNGTLLQEQVQRLVCDRTWLQNEELETEEVEPPVWTWKPPPPDDDQEPTMGSDYVSMVAALVELAAAGVKKDRLIRPSMTGKLTAYHFANSHIAELLQEGNEEKRYKSVIMDEDDISFFMVRDNATVAQRQMDHMLLKRSKFMCINDNMNHSNPAASEVKKVIYDFMNDYFPIPTEFELPDGVQNKHLHTFEYSPDEQRQYGWGLPRGLDPLFEQSMIRKGQPHPGYTDDYIFKKRIPPQTVFAYISLLWFLIGFVLVIYVVSVIRTKLSNLLFRSNPHPVPSAMC